MDFTVTIEQFDGPLDLMLHLIKEGELDLFSLDVAKLTDQYIDYIHAMQDMHLDVASEYLVELATLIEYKSKQLMPHDKNELEDNYEEEDESQQLVRRLIEYQRYKEVAESLESLYEERLQMHDKPVSDIASDWIKVDETYKETSPYELIRAMQKCLKRLQLEQPYEVSIQTKEITVDDRKKQLKTYMKGWGQTFTMTQTMEDCHDIYMVVINFLSILDLVNEGEINFTIKKDEVYFTKGVKA